MTQNTIFKKILSEIFNKEITASFFYNDRLHMFFDNGKQTINTYKLISILKEWVGKNEKYSLCTTFEKDKWVCFNKNKTIYYENQYEIDCLIMAIITTKIKMDKENAKN